MIKIERTNVMNFENAIRGARNPLNSWAKSDSYYDENNNYILGENDLGLAKRLAKAGNDHRKYLRQIFVSVDITAPLYWWKEFDTYKVGTVANSCSTMHKIHSKEFERDDFSHDRMTDIALACLDNTITVLEECRQKFVETKERKYWHDIIQLLPSSYNQMRTCTLNYENLINIYYARRNHKLPEWHTLCNWISQLPYFEEIVLEGEGEKE
ncbi:MAG: hypothetical protein J6R59_09850 [Paludibacteraceae bacterium]|nr:hypothetical protein [Paludibacteraceae bacterium]